MMQGFTEFLSKPKQNQTVYHYNKGIDDWFKSYHYRDDAPFSLPKTSTSGSLCINVRFAMNLPFKRKPSFNQHNNSYLLKFYMQLLVFNASKNGQL